MSTTLEGIYERAVCSMRELMPELSKAGDVLPCQCMPPEYGGCVCQLSERAVRGAYHDKIALTAAQREECYHEILCSEFAETQTPETLSDPDLASAVLGAWMNNAQDKM